MIINSGLQEQMGLEGREYYRILKFCLGYDFLGTASRLMKWMTEHKWVWRHYGCILNGFGLIWKKFMGTSI